MQTLVVLLTLFLFGVISQPHSIRFLHGSADAPALDVYLQGRLVHRALDWGTWTEYLLIDANVSQNVELKVANDYVTINQFTIPREDFNASRPQTVIIYGLYPDFQWRMIEQPCVPHGKGAWVNALHLIHGLEPVDISINSAGVCNGIDPNGDRLLWTNVEYEEFTDMRRITYPFSSYNVTVSLTRVPHPVLFQGPLVVQEGNTYTIVGLGEITVDPFSACFSRGTRAEPFCPHYPIRDSIWIILPSEFVATCVHS